ncbi:MAG TPA: type II secretion system protein GspE, partial [Anaerolineae bacterium]|nr:type II secretion system protein GspE [Anaerolineae bacterium]
MLTEKYNQIDLTGYPIKPKAVAALQEMFARRYSVMPMDFEGQKLVVAISDTSNVVVLDDLQMITGYEIKPVLAHEDEIVSVINRYYRMGNAVKSEVSELQVDAVVDERADSILGISEEAPVIRLVNMIIIRAVNERASDIHIEPQERDVRVRYRVDGVLHEV